MQKVRMHMRLLQIIFLTGVFSFQTLAQTSYASSPQAVVKRYCKLDFGGSRLSSNGFQTMAGLYDWEGEPGWDESIVIKSFAVKGQKIDGRHAVVSVEYIQVGTLGGESFESSQKVEEITFKLIKKGGRWRITSPIIPPHVSVLATQRHVEGLVRDEGEESAGKWSKTLDALKALSNQ